MAFFNILFFVLMVGAVVKSRGQEARNGLLTLIGASGRTLDSINLQGQAVIRGEIWRVQSKKPIAANANIRVIQAKGLLLEVEEETS
jgi:membrane-bound serine protease (ClpP class)